MNPRPTVLRLVVTLAIMAGVLAATQPARILPSTEAGHLAQGPEPQSPAASLDLVGQFGGAVRAVALSGSTLYVGIGPRLVIFSLANPAAPAFTGQTAVMPGVVQDIAVAGTTAYVANGSGGLRVINVSNPAVPTEAGRYLTPDSANGVAVAGTTVFVAAGSAGLLAINAGNASNPALLGSYDTPGSAHDVVVANNLAYVADGDRGLRGVNVSDAANPTNAGSFDSPGTAERLALNGNTAYLADGNSGLRIYNVANPADISQTGFFDTAGYAEGVTLAGTLAYVSDRDRGLLILNIGNPAAPGQAGTRDTEGWAIQSVVAGSQLYLADSAALRTLNISNPASISQSHAYNVPGFAFDVAVTGGTVFVADWEGGLSIINAAIPASPTLYGAVDLPRFSLGIAAAGSYAYVANEANGLRIFNVSNPAVPAEVGSYDTPGSAWGVTTLGGYAYVADWDAGLRVLNVGNPAAPTPTGFLDTAGLARNVLVDSGRAYVVDREGGLRIVQIANPAAPTPLGVYDTPGWAVGIALNGNTAYVADSAEGLRILNVGNPSAPNELGFYDTPGTAEGVAFGNNIAFVADGGGVRAINVTNPAAPSEIAFFDTAGAARAIVLAGDYLYVGDWNGGLYILRYNPGGPTATPTATPTPPATATPTPTLTPTAGSGDSFEDDDACGRAKNIGTNGSKQTHTFHAPSDADWLAFSATANRTYVIEVTSVGPSADPVLLLYDSCDQAPAASDDNAFGQTVRLEWDATANTTYYLKVQQHDGAIYGPDTGYEISVQVDNVPPERPRSPRCASVNTTTLAVQWQKSSDRDVIGYQLHFRDENFVQSGAEDVTGQDTTYYELGGLTSDKLYYLSVSAVDFSGNTSQKTAEIFCRTIVPSDTTRPNVTLEQPTTGTEHTTTVAQITITGNANDSGNNLSRVQVRNTSNNAEGWDYSIEGGTDTFRVEDLTLGIGSNQLVITVFDTTGNSNSVNLTVNRTGQTQGAVIIIAGNNETFSLQTNIYNAANRAYRVFKGAGYNPDNIYYLSPTSQDADGDGSNDVDAVATSANLQQAIQTWAASRVGADKPLFLYMMDHGVIEGFCTAGCGSARTTAQELDTWLSGLEAATGANKVSVIIEMCHSGSFIDRTEDVASSIAKAGRVVIASTGRTNNAYASAQGAYFSDAFFSCIAASNHLKTCFDQASAAVAATGVNQTPWMDDNGDGISSPADGTLAQTRYVSQFFGASPPQILQAAVTVNGADGTLTARIQPGAESIGLVWAAVYPPSFQEPTETTLNLGVPIVRLEKAPGSEDLYQVSYASGFAEEGLYRVVFYAQDRLGDHAQPTTYFVGDIPGEPTFLPLLMRAAS